ncbi:MAG: T9SS type A sorting domain-containing protein [Bacteroidota bacterium]|nr:T9SS type A sorting domain-containing protein [Bacteroidota bacterium]
MSTYLWDVTLVTLKVYNLLGQEVATLVNEVKSPGEYLVQWNAGNNTSGLYFYCLQTKDYVETKKLILIR